MSNKEFIRSLGILVLAAALLTGCLFTAAALAPEEDEPTPPPVESVQPSPEPEEVPEEPEYVALSLKMDAGDHDRYISGYEDGSFRPDASITRAEAASMLWGLLAQRPEDRAAFADVAETDWYYDAIGLLGAGGILVSGDDSIRPTEEVSRGEFVAMLSRFYPDLDIPCSYSDVPEDHPYYRHIAKATANGWISGYEDGSFKPEKSITRAEATTVINHVLCREADAAWLDSVYLPLFHDVPRTHWAYYEIMEAALPHVSNWDFELGESWTWVDAEVLPFTSGILVDGLDVYYVDEKTGLPVTDTTVGSLSFGGDGRYTSGNPEVDALVRGVLETIVTEDMTQEERLRAAYEHVRDNYIYLRRNYYDKGETGWEVAEAYTMLKTKRGNCYNYAAAFCCLARQLGYDARIVSGGTGWSDRPHGWVEIDSDGVPYIYDTELDMSYRKQGVYTYNFYKLAYPDVPWPYYKAE